MNQQTSKNNSFRSSELTQNLLCTGIMLVYAMYDLDALASWSENTMKTDSAATNKKATTFQGLGFFSDTRWVVKGISINR